MATKKPARKASERRKPPMVRRGKRLLARMARSAVKSVGRAMKSRAVTVVEWFTREEVVARASRDLWKKDYPDPKHPTLNMRKVMPEDDLEEYEATFDGELVVPFAIFSWSNVSVRDAAYEEAEDVHGPVAKSWMLTGIEPMNDLARAVLPTGADW